ncbi:hypothetical protein WA026_023065 [Henosepilachna vigintioctopunctata]|uniref:Uncharacterized protein n=1 Tax=Henosepilachna vigintioctopunctata TaxID=420089 RepID=A0AAW1V319_9CUCU
MFLSLLSKANCQPQDVAVPAQETPKMGLVQSFTAGRTIAVAVAEGEGVASLGKILHRTYTAYRCITHTAVVHLHLVKCRIQVDPAKYKGRFHGFKVTLKEDGMRGLAKGWAPSFFGYSIQGLCKFGLYEVAKHMPRPPPPEMPESLKKKLAAQGKA